MKYLLYPLLSITGILLVACQKAKTPTVTEAPAETTELSNGLGDNYEDVHGYLYAGFTRNAAYNNHNDYGSLVEFCSFRDPSTDLVSSYDHLNQGVNFTSFFNNMGNVSVGAVTFNDQSVPMSNSGQAVTYQTNGGGTNYTFPAGAKWHSAGNGSFKALDLSVSRGFPRFKSFPLYDMSQPTYTASRSEGFTLNLADQFSNYDSLSFSFGYPGGSTAILKTVDAETKTVYFSPDELSPVSMSGSATQQVYISLYNYSHKTIENKRYIFELSTKAITFVAIVP